MKIFNKINSEIVEPELTDAQKTELRHERVREIRQNPEVLSDLPNELFLRLVGLFNTIPEKIRHSGKYIDNSREFEELRSFIDDQLAGEDGKNFASAEMGDYVHNLNLLLIGVMPIDMLEANIENVRRDYQSHVDDSTYKAFLNTELHLYVDKYSRNHSDTGYDEAIYEEKIRAEYRNLTNENRRAKLLEGHIETTRGFLMRQVKRIYLQLISVPLLILLIYAGWTYRINYNSVHFLGLRRSTMTLIDKKGFATHDAWLNGFASVTIFTLAGIAGATGALISVLLRIEGVRDNTQLGQNLVTFKYSVNSVRTVPLTGLIFAVVLSLLFAGNVISGSIFPKIEDGALLNTVMNVEDVAKWLVWGFIAGFSERLVPDMVDRLAEKAKKGD